MKTLLSGILNLTVVTALSFTGWQSAQAQAQGEIEKELQAETHCMALNIYHEARGSSLADQAATADVVLNRMYDTRYPDTICDVVHQGTVKPSWKDETVMVPVRNKCQFSWWCDGRDDTPRDTDRWVSAQTLAYQIVVEGKYRGITEGSTHYHATYVNPRWSSDLQLVGRIGAHIFYRWDQ